MNVKPNAFPDTVSAPVRKLLQDFYHLSNAASSHTEHKKDEQKLVSLFTPDGVYEFAGKKNEGHEAILAFRAGLFSNIGHRDHQVVKVYPFGNNDQDLLALGEVEYRGLDGASHKEQWAGRYAIVQDGGELKFKQVQIFIVSHHSLEWREELADRLTWRL